MANKPYEELKIFALAQDPIYIGTGGYTLGRVDNTIVRDKATNIPKIPGSSLAGTWRYYVVLEGLKDIKNFQPSWKEIKDEKGNTIGEKLANYNWRNKDISKLPDWKKFPGNQLMKITCAGQDNLPQENIENAPFSVTPDGKSGHCGHCIVCKGFGFSKKNLSWQGQLFFNDLHIALFPVFTAEGTKWITTERIIEEIYPKSGNGSSKGEGDNNYPLKVCISESPSEGSGKYINLGWLYLPCQEVHELYSKVEQFLKELSLPFEISSKDIVIVPEHLFAHIVNSNLEVRTSVSIDPITGAAKEGALFTTEAIPRGTVFYGKIYIFDRKSFEDLDPRIKPLPGKELLKNALKDSSHYYETLGIGGMTTRGFGRLKIWFSQ